MKLFTCNVCFIWSWILCQDSLEIIIETGQLHLLDIQFNACFTIYNYIWICSPSSFSSRSCHHPWNLIPHALVNSTLFEILFAFLGVIRFTLFFKLALTYCAHTSSLRVPGSWAICSGFSILIFLLLCGWFWNYIINDNRNIYYLVSNLSNKIFLFYDGTKLIFTLMIKLFWWKFIFLGSGELNCNMFACRCRRWN